MHLELVVVFFFFFIIIISGDFLVFGSSYRFSSFDMERELELNWNVLFDSNPHSEFH